MPIKIKFLSAGGSGGGGTDTNLGNANLTADATTRSYTMASGGNLEIKNNSGNNIVDFTTTNLEIGSTNKYTMPNARGTADEILGLTNGTGTAAWRTLTNTIEAQQQTLVGNGQVASLSPARDEVYGFDLTSGGFRSLGVNPSSITYANFFALFPPFRQTSSTDYGYGTGNDRMLIKFASAIADIFQFSIIQVAMPDGATSPLTISKTVIGTFDNRLAGNRIQCLDYDMSSISSTTCTALFLVWQVTGGGARAEQLYLAANYVQPNLILNTFS
jgi:hypothetical protein